MLFHEADQDVPVASTSGSIRKKLVDVALLLTMAINGWLHGRIGRALRLTVGDMVVEATSAGELYGLFDLMTAVTEPHKRFASNSV